MAGAQDEDDVACMLIVPVGFYDETYQSSGSRLTSLHPSWAMSSCENNGNSTWMPPIEFSVQCIECVTTALTSCREYKKNRLVQWNFPAAIKRTTLTCNIRACGVCTKYETLPFGADCKHSWPSVATGLYMKTIAFDNLPS